MKTETETLKKRLDDILQEIRPYLQRDEGDVEVVSVSKDFDVVVQLLGACSTCSINYQTFKYGIEETIRKHLPQIQSVTAVNEAGVVIFQ